MCVHVLLRAVRTGDPGGPCGLLRRSGGLTHRMHGLSLMWARCELRSQCARAHASRTHTCSYSVALDGHGLAPWQCETRVGITIIRAACSQSVQRCFEGVERSIWLSVCDFESSHECVRVVLSAVPCPPRTARARASFRVSSVDACESRIN